MHVAVATTVHHPADARIAARQIPAILDAGHDVTYLAAFTARGVSPPPGVDAIDLPRSSGRRRLRALRHALRELRGVGRIADIVLIHDPELLAAGVAWGDRSRLVWDVHEDTPASLTDRPWIPRGLVPLLSRTMAGVEALAERHVRLILAEDRYRARFHRNHPVVHNYPWVPDEVRPAGPGRAVYVGRLSTSRGLRELVETGRRLRGHVDVELIGAPDDQDAPIVRDALTRGHVRGEGAHVPNEEALARIEGATVGLNLVHDHPNHRVSLQTKLLEYLARGLPVITTPLPAAVEVVERHECGIVVPFGDVDAVVAAVRQLNDDAELRTSMSQRGRQAVREHHDWRTEGHRFVSLLEGWAR